MRTHELKTWPSYFQQVKSGNKKFEVRKNDREFCEGDLLILKEWDYEKESYTGNEVKRFVDYIFHGGHWGIEQGYCVVSLTTPEEQSLQQQLASVKAHMESCRHLIKAKDDEVLYEEITGLMEERDKLQGLVQVFINFLVLVKDCGGGTTPRGMILSLEAEKLLKDFASTQAEKEGV